MQPSAGNIMTSVFWDSEGVTHVDFLPHDVTINAQCYINLLFNDVCEVVCKSRPWKLSKIIILHGNAHPHKVDLMNVAMAAVYW